MCLHELDVWIYTGGVIVMQDVAPVLPVTSAAWCELRGRKLMVLSNSFQNRAAVMKRGTLPPKGEQCNSAVAFSCSHFDLEDKSLLYQKATNFTFLSCYWQSCKVAVVLDFSTTHCPFACPRRVWMSVSVMRVLFGCSDWLSIKRNRVRFSGFPGHSMVDWVHNFTGCPPPPPCSADLSVSRWASTSERCRVCELSAGMWFDVVNWTLGVWGSSSLEKKMSILTRHFKVFQNLSFT